MLTLVQPLVAQPAGLRATTILIVDGQQLARTILRHIVEGIGSCLEIVDFESPIQALSWAQGNHVDLLLLGYEMPGMNGLEFAREFLNLPMRNDVPIVLISETADEPLRQAAFDAGVLEFLIRPVRPREMAARCKNLLGLRANGESAKLRARSLELELSDTRRRLEDRERETLLRLIAATEFRDHGSGLHLVRVARIAGLIARALGMTIEESSAVELAAPLHDVGKIGVPDSILQKTAPLSEQELTLMQRHSVIGYEILRNSQNPLVQLGSMMALCHHERWGGGGYPHGLVGADIPQAARIVAVADVFDALLSDRPYKRVWACDRAVEYVAHHRGTRFDPACVDALLCDMRLVREITSWPQHP